MHKKLLTAAVVLALGAQLEAAMAQSSPPMLEEVTVTAERRSGSLQSVPIAVSAITPDSLENMMIETTQDLQRLVPGLRITDNITSPTNFTIALRGSIQQDASIIVTESPVGIYIDDIYIPRLTGANAQLTDLERVEVMRGTQGTLYGRNTLSGAMNFVTRTPDQEGWAHMSAGAGSYGRFRVDGSTGGQLSENLFGSLAVVYNGTDGFFDNVATGRDFGRERNGAVRGKLRWLTGGWDVVGTLSYARSTNNAQPLVAATVPATGVFTSSDVTPVFGNEYRLSVPSVERSGFNTRTPRGKTEQIIASLNASYEMDFATFRSITGYVGTEDFFSNDLSGLGFIPLGSDLESKSYSQEFQLLGTAMDGKLDWITGLYLFRERADQNLLLFTSMLLDIETDSVAAFGQFNYRLTDDLSVTAGLRWTEDKKTFTGGIRALDFPFPDVDFRSKDTFNAWTPKLSLNYEMPVSGDGFFQSALTYASVARGFKSGGYNGIPVVSPQVLSTVYEPEENWTYELGFKAEMLDRRLRLNAAYFYSEIEDLTANATLEEGGTPVFPVSNVADATVKGLELELTAMITSGLRMFANATFQDGRYRNVTPGSSPEIALNQFGQANIPQLPDYTVVVGFDYTHDFDMNGRAAAFKFGADWFRTDDYAVLVNNDYYIQAFSRYGGFVALEWDKLEFRVTATNLADKAQYVSGSRDLGGFILLPPREIMATVRYRLQ